MPAADDDGIAVMSGRHRLTMLDKAGKVRWEVRRDYVRDVAPVLTDDPVLAPTGEGLVAYDRASGRERWVATLGDRTNTPAVIGARAVVTTWEGSLAAVDVATGNVGVAAAAGR